ncbi:MAG: hypothetical protein AAB504_03125 [Patescibacteria group bacterium]
MENYNLKLKNNLKILTFFIVILIFTFLFFNFVQAAGLVPCGPESHDGKGCQFCDLIILVGKVINFALYDIAIPLVVVFIVWGGLTIMTAGDSTEKVSQGRKMIQSAIIGVFIALGAWMIINMVLSAIGGGEFVPWKFGDYSIC